MGKRRRFSGEFNAEVVLSLLTGEKTNAEMCREHGITSQTLGNWKQQFIANASRAFESDRTENGEDGGVSGWVGMVGKTSSAGVASWSCLACPLSGMIRGIAPVAQWTE